MSAPQGPGPYLSLADGWDEQATDLRARASNLQRRVAAVRDGTTPTSLDDVTQERHLDAAIRNIAAATVLEQCARNLRQHHEIVTRPA